MPYNVTMTNCNAYSPPINVKIPSYSVGCVSVLQRPLPTSRPTKAFSVELRQLLDLKVHVTIAQGQSLVRKTHIAAASLNRWQTL